jgi:hypothetical protein
VQDEASIETSVIAVTSHEDENPSTPPTAVTIAEKTTPSTTTPANSTPTHKVTIRFPLPEDTTAETWFLTLPPTITHLHIHAHHEPPDPWNTDYAVHLTALLSAPFPSLRALDLDFPNDYLLRCYLTSSIDSSGIWEHAGDEYLSLGDVQSACSLKGVAFRCDVYDVWDDNEYDHFGEWRLEHGYWEDGWNDEKNYYTYGHCEEEDISE